jgi:hypothetical protein
MGIFSLITKPVRILDVLAEVIEKEVVDKVVSTSVDFATGDWAGEDREAPRN